jgi:hypothetical protein
VGFSGDRLGPVVLRFLLATLPSRNQLYCAVDVFAHSSMEEPIEEPFENDQTFVHVVEGYRNRPASFSIVLLNLLS